MRKRTTTAALLAGAFLLTGCANHQQKVNEERFDRIDQALVMLADGLIQIDARNAEYHERLWQTTDAYTRDRQIEVNRRSSLQTQLQTVRSQIELYKHQHNGLVPELMYGWHQLTKKTAGNGEIWRGEIDGQGYGPYLQTSPKNPYTHSRKVCPVEHIDPEAGWAWDDKHQKFYAVVSDLEKEENGLFDDDVVVYSHKEELSTRAVRADLAVLRNALDLYVTEHAIYPSVGDFNAQLTQYTNRTGAVSEERVSEFIFGPYIRWIPTNKLTGRQGVSLITKPDPDSGWVYSPETGEIRLLIVDREQYDQLPKHLLRADVFYHDARVSAANAE